MFWDAEAFFDSICIVKLVRAARSLGFSPLLLYIGLQCHLATRVFKIGNWVSDKINPITSIIAGCNLSDKFTKIIFHSMMELAHQKFRGVRFGQFFDDIAQLQSIPKGHSWWGFLKSVKFVADSFSFLRVTFSKSKSMLVASTPQLT